MSELPEEVTALLAEREQARAAKDYAKADEIRARIGELGFEIRDSAHGATAVPKQRFEVIDPKTIPDSLSEPSTKQLSIHVLHDDRFPGDLDRFVDSFAKHCGGHDYEIVVTECTGTDVRDDVRVLHFPTGVMWADGRNASIKTSAGEIIAIADLSVEASGDVLGSVIKAFDDPEVGVAGPWGLTSKDMRSFEAAPPGEVDAVEGYFLATRREIARRASFDEKFRWYRHADIDYSFQIRALGYKAVAVEASAERHAHRAWESASDEERARLSKKNFNRFLERFRDRHDLLLSHRDH